MKIVFNGLSSGCGNNGGTITIFKSANTMRVLGHIVEIAAFVDNMTWFKHRPVINHLPAGFDVVINIAAVDYEITRKSHIQNKVCWWRANELWGNTEEYLKYCYTDTEVYNFVNSKGLQKLLQSYGADSEVIYQGIDFDWWEDRKLHKDEVIRIGCLYQKKVTKRWEDFVKLSQILGDGYEYVGFGFDKRNDNFLTDYKQNPTHDELVDLYSSCKIWFAPTELEGLHNVPIEAALCGCLIVCSDAPMNGMIYDYASNNNTAMVYEAGNIEQAAELIKNPDWKCRSRMVNHLKTKIGTREYNMKKMISYLELM